jgi:alpha-tubulin suppressor-like RCC1 family protein
VLKVCLGFHHAAAITEEGLLFTWGRGVNGQLGHGELPSEVISNFNFL